MGKEVITKICEVHNIKIPGEPYSHWDGYQINTNIAIYLFLIENGQSCCEDWGYLSTPDDTTEFEFAELLKIEKVPVNACADNPDLKEKIDDKYEPADTMFINVETSNGLLQFAAYNQHNGYYGHDVLCIKMTKIAEETL